MSVSVNLPLHPKVQKFSSGIGSRGWSRKKDRKTVVVCGVVAILDILVVRSLLWAEVQPSPDPSAETVSKSSARAEERGGQLVVVCVTCGEGRLSRREQPCWAFLGAPCQGVAYCLDISPVKKSAPTFPRFGVKKTS